VLTWWRMSLPHESRAVRIRRPFQRGQVSSTHPARLTHYCPGKQTDRQDPPHPMAQVDPLPSTGAASMEEIEGHTLIGS
jgi:hypothetical protein